MINSTILIQAKYPQKPMYEVVKTSKIKYLKVIFSVLFPSSDWEEQDIKSQIKNSKKNLKVNSGIKFILFEFIISMLCDKEKT